MRPRTPKKTETIEVRLPYATKAAFMARCQRDGRTASDAIRQFIDRELGTKRAAARLSRLGQVLAAALMGLAVGAVAAPTLAHPVIAGPAACGAGGAAPASR
jgi:hypothetical protein